LHVDLGMIALITDFGYRDYFVGVLKGVIRKINPDVEIVDISHGVKSFSVVNAQFILYSSYRYFPAGTIFCIVVDPGVGTERRGLIAQGRDYCYVLPDNGIVSAAIASVSDVYTIADDFFESSSPTFHGRDVFAPVSAYIAKGQRPENFGYRISDFIEKKFPDYKLADNGFSGLVAHIDTFGNAVLSIPNQVIKEDNRICYIVNTGKFEFRATSCKTYGELGKSQVGLIKGSSGFIELAISGDSLAGHYEINIEDDVVISYD
jgi:S-adenosylmethionine hydrolase